MKLLKFKHGFTIGNFTFGWYNKELYRLPSESKRRVYSFKKLNKIKVGNKDGYRVLRKKYSLNQLRDLTTEINKNIPVHTKKDKDLPF